MTYAIQLTEIKRLLLLKVNIKNVTPKDCESISLQINKEVSKHISVTTLKRLFGLAVQRYKFSTFTLLTLSDFLNIEYTKYETIDEDALQKVDEWKAIKAISNNITDRTLQKISDSCGIPHGMTVARNFAEEDFMQFYTSTSIFTSFVSLAGDGKSVLISNLAQKLFKTSKSTYNNSTLLYMTAGDFFHEGEANFDADLRLKQLLGMEIRGDMFEYLDHGHITNGGKFVIILDDFTDHFLSRWSCDQLFSTLRNLILTLKYFGNIKLVISMRTIMWSKFYLCIQQSDYLKSMWFPGSHYRLEDHTNIPKLSNEETELLLLNINSALNNIISPTLKDQLKSTDFIKLYFDFHQKNTNLNCYCDTVSNELVSMLIQRSIYNTKNCSEKIPLLKKIAQLTKVGVEHPFVPITNVPGITSIYKTAYDELLDTDILIKETKYVEESRVETIRFKHDCVFEYFLFVQLIEKFSLTINEDFFKHVKSKYKNSPVEIRLLQWTIRFLLKTGNFKPLTLIFSVNFEPLIVTKLVLYMAEEIKYRSQYNSSFISLLDEGKFHETIVSEIDKFDSYDPYFEFAISALIEITNNIEQVDTYKMLLLNFFNPSFKVKKNRTIKKTSAIAVSIVMGKLAS
ncbi:hypothetical protein [Pedobacter sp. L105]|uniref:hypothetical protein n=1 Tax=Pedobacter sp. L105 TaxID=1641871 RepID=UPI00131D0E25|nr:hypothetical protein [Pedobacter sp. L105]